MADYESLFPGRFIKAADLNGKEVTVAIKSIKSEEIEEKTKAILSFEGTKKSMVMNRTNAEACALMFGREMNDWIGKRITLYPKTMKDPFSDGEIIAIRIKGSPDITAPKSKEVKRGRKTISVSVVPTGKAAAAAAKPGNGKPAGATQTPGSEPTPEEQAEILARERAQASGDAPF